MVFVKGPINQAGLAIDPAAETYKKQVQGDQLYMAVLFWYLVKRDLSSVRHCTVAYTSALLARYQNNTVMFIWSGCTLYKHTFSLSKRQNFR